MDDSTGMSRHTETPRWAGLLLVGCLSWFILPLPAAAWGPLGHAVIGELAEACLLRDDRALTRLLSRFGQPSWRRQVRQALLNSDPSTPGTALQFLANWPDVHKREPGMLTDDSRRHYVNLPHHAVYSRARHCPDGVCSIETLLEQRAILADRGTPLPQRAVALAWVTHLMGDIHQPLHAGHAADRGGTLFCVSWKRQSSTLITVNGMTQCSGPTLHAVWDSKILEEITGMSHPDAAKSLARQLRPLLRQVDASEPPLTAQTDAAWRAVIERWHTETQALILLDQIYPHSHSLGRAYARQHYDTVRLQLVRAAVRLAAVLRQTLQEP